MSTAKLTFSRGQPPSTIDTTIHKASEHLHNRLNYTEWRGDDCFGCIFHQEIVHCGFPVLHGLRFNYCEHVTTTKKCIVFKVCLQL